MAIIDRRFIPFNDPLMLTLLTMAQQYGFSGPYSQPIGPQMPQVESAAAPQTPIDLTQTQQGPTGTQFATQTLPGANQWQNRMMALQGQGNIAEIYEQLGRQQEAAKRQDEAAEQQRQAFATEKTAKETETKRAEFGMTDVIAQRKFELAEKGYEPEELKIVDEIYANKGDLTPDTIKKISAAQKRIQLKKEIELWQQRRQQIASQIVEIPSKTPGGEPLKATLGAAIAAGVYPADTIDTLVGPMPGSPAPITEPPPPKPELREVAAQRLAALGGRQGGKEQPFDLGQATEGQILRQFLQDPLAAPRSASEFVSGKITERLGQGGQLLRKAGEITGPPPTNEEMLKYFGQEVPEYYRQLAGKAAGGVKGLPSREESRQRTLQEQTKAKSYVDQRTAFADLIAAIQTNDKNGMQRNLQLYAQAAGVDPRGVIAMLVNGGVLDQQTAQTMMEMGQRQPSIAPRMYAK